MEDYKVCIPAAGKGSRMAEFSRTFNKALLPVHGKPAICHIIEKFPENIEIVVALGHKKETLVDFLTPCYPERKITFVDVGRYEGPGTGPGYSILQCKDHLQSPFIYASADSLVREEIPAPENNWFGVAEVSDTTRFCSAKVLDGRVVRIDDKVKCDNKYAFMGIAGVKDYEHFWKNLESNDSLIGGEIQVSNGFTSLVEKGMEGVVFTWFDTGIPKAYEHALKNYPGGEGYSGGEDGL
jgi:NDP-sugar pyrophosphorylase family protein